MLPFIDNLLSCKWLCYPRQHGHKALFVISAWCMATVALPQSHSWKWSFGLSSSDPEQFNDVAVDNNDASVYAIGDAQNSNIQIGPFNLFDQDQGVLAKFESTGALLWYVPIGGSDQETAESVAVGPDGTVYITGGFQGSCYLYDQGSILAAATLTSFSGSVDIYMAAYTSSGQLLWAKQLGANGSTDEKEPRVTADASGPTFSASFKGSLTYNTLSSAASLSSNNYDLALLHLDPTGNTLWMRTGGSTLDDYITSIASDGTRIYTATLSGGTPLRWYDSSGSLIGQSASTNRDHHYIAFTSSGGWGWAAAVNDPNNGAIGDPCIAVNCAGVFVTGAVGPGSSLLGSSPSGGNGNEYMYLARLDPTTGAGGSNNWVKWGVTNNGSGLFRPSSIALGKYGLIHVGGYMDGSISYGGQSISTSNNVDGFLLTTRRDGVVKAFNAIGGDNDQNIRSIAADDFGGIITAGWFKEEMNIPSHQLSGNGSSVDAFVAFAQFGAREPAYAERTRFSAPTEICQAAANIDLSTWMVGPFSGNATAVAGAQTNVTNPSNAIGSANLSVATMAGGNSSFTVDLGTTVPSGEAIGILWKRNASATAASTLAVSVSTDNASWTPLGSNLSTNRTTYQYTWIRPMTATRYLKVSNISANGAADIDAFSYSYGTETGGVWSGTGVSGTTFTPSACPAGPVAITYTLNYGGCSYSTTRTVQIVSVTGGTISGPATVCPGGSATFSLAGGNTTSNLWYFSTNSGSTWNTFGAANSTTNTLANITATAQVLVRSIQGSCSAPSNTLTITPADNTFPVFTNCPGDIIVQAPALATTVVVNFSAPTATDNCGAITLVQTAGPASGSAFPIGTTQITFKATDATNHSTECSFNVNVTPDAFPTIICPNDITVNSNPGQCGAVVTYTVPIGTDNEGPATTIQTDGSGYTSNSFFPVGVVQQRYTVTDNTSNSVSCSFQVRVIDAESPTIVCPPDQTIQTPASSCTAQINYALPVSTDNCGATTPTLVSGPANNSTRPPGEYTVVYQVQDARPNTATCSFHISIRDDNAPDIVCPPNDTLAVDPLTCTTATPTYQPVATDNCAVAVVWQYSGPSSGTLLDITNSPYFARWAVRDNSGNLATCEQVITVIDDAPPVINCAWPWPIVLYADQNVGVPVPALDTQQSYEDCSPLVHSQDPAAGTLIIDDTLITTTVTANGLSSTTTDLVVVLDTVPPNLICPNDTVRIGATVATCSADASGVLALVMATDGVLGSVTLAQIIGPALGSPIPGPGFFDIGFIALDPDSNSSLCRFTLAVVDTTGPQLSCPAHPPLTATSVGCTAVLPDYAAISNANDICSTEISIDQSPAPGTSVSNGTLVTITAQDSSGNQSNCSFTVQVEDRTPPLLLDCPADERLYSTSGACSVLYDPPTVHSTDNCDTDSESDHQLWLLEDGTATWQNVTSATDHTLAPGMHRFFDVHRDDSDNQDTCFWTVEVVDTLAPTITTPGNIIAYATANSCGTPVEFLVEFDDECALLNTSVVPASGSFFPVGTHGIIASAQDINLNITTAPAFTITVLDTVRPVIALSVAVPAIQATSGCSAAMPDWISLLSASDNCGLAPGSISQSPAAGTSVSGVFTVTFVVTDIHSNSRSLSITASVTDADTDNDGIPDCSDPCPNGANPGASCNDNNACTINDVIQANCACAGTVQDTDGDGTCDANDGCPNDPNKIAPGICGCGVADTDSDNDGIANCVDPCPNGANPGAGCNDNNACTINDVIQANCSCAGTVQDTDGDGTCDANDGCPNDPNKIAPGICGCGVADTDSDNDGIADCVDPCPNGANPGASCNDNNACTINDVIQANCTCAGTVQDTDGDGTCDANDGCPNDPNKIAPGICGCGVADTDSDSDGIADCMDPCPNGANPGAGCNDNNACTINDVIQANCTCAGTVQDTDGDGTCDANDGCPNDPNKIAPGICGCGVADTDSDSDGIANCVDPCPNGANPGASCNDNNACTINDVIQANCTCAGTVQDTDGDGTCDANDGCPNDPNKIAPGICGCGVADTDTDNDGIADCVDPCPNGANPGASCNDNNACTINDVIQANCTCAGTVQDTDGDGTCDANDGCPNDPNKIAPGICGCGVADTDTDNDGIANCVDPCPNGANPGASCNDNNACTINDVIQANCTCSGTVQDNDGDGTCDANDGCPNDPNKIAPGICGCGVADTDTDNDGIADCVDPCPNGANPGASCNDNNACTINDVIQANCTCTGTVQDTDGDGTCDANDGCPNDPNKIAPGICGCGVADTDTDNDGIANCVDPCPNGPNPGTACNDGDPNTGNDVINASCQCAGSVLDCDGNPGGPNVAGAPCDDQISCTINDHYNIACQCVGETTDPDNDGWDNCIDECPYDPNKIEAGVCGCGVTDTDSDNDGIADCVDPCPNGANPGASCNDNNACTINDVIQANCSCAGTVQDTDGDGTCDANDGCPNDPNKIAPGICGCGVADTDTDNDGIANCVDPCPNGANPGASCNDNNACTINDVIQANCTCSGTVQDNDGDGTCDANDGCPNDPNKIAPGICGCGVADTDTDNDGIADCVDPCPNGANPGASCNDNNACTINDVIQANCTCTGTVQDTDGDGTCDANDGCPNDPNKIAPGICGCGVADTDTDGDGIADCNDNCPALAGQIGDACDDGNASTSNDLINANCVCAGTQANDCNGVPGGSAQPGSPCDDNNVCTVNDAIQANCVCAGTVQDTDGDGTCDASDGCPNDPNKIAPGICGCGVADTDTDNDGIADCVDPCPNGANPGASCNDNNACTINDVIQANCTCAGTVQDTDGDGTCDANDGCPNDPNKIAPGICGCGVADTDTDNDGIADCVDPCPNGANPGASCNDNNACTINDVIQANCTCAGTVQDTDGDGTCDANDGCPNDPNKIAPGICGCGVADTDSDNDGIANCNDNCPNLTGQIGDACDDGNLNTSNDVINANCVCAGTQANDCNGVPGGSAQPGSPCDDDNVCTVNDVYQANCVCAGTVQDTDGDGTCDANDGCPNDPNKIAPGICGCGIADTDSDGDSTADCADPCPSIANVSPGDACDDGVVLTYNDVYDQNCNCIGSVIDCQDDDPCTLDAWDANTQTCIHTPIFVDAGWTAPLMACGSIGPIDLNTMAPVMPGGTWSGTQVNGSLFDPTGLNGGVTISHVINIGGCMDTVTQVIQVVPGPHADAGDDAQTCGLEHSLEAVVDVVPGNWTGPSGAIFSEPSDPNTMVSVPVAGEYDFVWSVGDGQCSDRDTVHISFLEAGTSLTVNAGPDQSIDVATSAVLSGSVTNGATITWSSADQGLVFDNISDPATTVSGLSSGENLVILSATFGSCATASDTMVVRVNDIFVPQGFSPNGDGVNDLFEITGIRVFPDNDLSIFDRWGQEVYSRHGYHNEWDGRGRSGQPLIDDTYFYVLNLSKERTYNGFVIIKR